MSRKCEWRGRYDSAQSTPPGAGAPLRQSGDEYESCGRPEERQLTSSVLVMIWIADRGCQQRRLPSCHVTKAMSSCGGLSRGTYYFLAFLPSLSPPGATGRFFELWISSRRA